MAWKNPRPAGLKGSDAGALRAIFLSLQTYLSGSTDAVVIAADLAAHLADTSDAHDASAISILDTAADFTATDVEGALAELQADSEGHWLFVNTDSDTGRTFYVGSIDPDTSYTPVTGDVWGQI